MADDARGGIKKISSPPPPFPVGGPPLPLLPLYAPKDGRRAKWISRQGAERRRKGEKGASTTQQRLLPNGRRMLENVGSFES